MKLQPVRLVGNYARLEPLGHEHIEDLAVAAASDEIWEYLDEATPQSTLTMETLIRQAIDDQSAGRRLPFAVIDVATNRAVGSTSYIDLRPADRGLEIGWTWLSPTVWGSGVNLECKYLLLQHAFDDHSAIRVALKTDSRNVRSQRAIEKLGAAREGVWRNHRILSTGRYRDTVYFSIIESEWPSVKESLQGRLRP